MHLVMSPPTRWLSYFSILIWSPTPIRRQKAVIIRCPCHSITVWCILSTSGMSSYCFSAGTYDEQLMPVEHVVLWCSDYFILSLTIFPTDPVSGYLFNKYSYVHGIIVLVILSLSLSYCPCHIVLVIQGHIVLVILSLSLSHCPCPCHILLVIWSLSYKVI